MMKEFTGCIHSISCFKIGPILKNHNLLYILYFSIWILGEKAAKIKDEQIDVDKTCAYEVAVK